MPYRSKSELPEKLSNVLPDHAQEIYVEAFNSAWVQYDEPEERRDNSSREETAFRVAWAAVKKKYEKDPESGKWKEKEDS
jgi:cation transport regulator